MDEELFIITFSVFRAINQFLKITHITDYIF